MNYFLIDRRVHFVDLPGYGYAKVSQEERQRWSQLMEDFFSDPARITLGVMLVDARHRPTADDVTMKERIQKLLSARGVASRRTAEKMIEAGRVTVNGVPAVLGESADPDTDDIRADGAPLPAAPPKTYIMLNKPKGYVTTLSDEKGRKDVSQLVAEVGERLYPVGRLDLNSEGLLLMTNDGDMANRLMHPSHNIRKTYHTWVRGGELDEAVRMLQGPMVTALVKAGPEGIRPGGLSLVGKAKKTVVKREGGTVRPI